MNESWKPASQRYCCRVCAAELPIATPLPWRCQRANNFDRHHALAVIGSRESVESESVESESVDSESVDSESDNPFLAFRERLTWDAFAQQVGVTAEGRIEAIAALDDDIAAVAGSGFRFTPFARNDGVSAALGFNETGGVWIKDETNNVGGSHKARHLFTTMLQLRLAESLSLAPWSGRSNRPALAIASCGNAAIAAATIAAAARWPIQVFVPHWAGGTVVDMLSALDAVIIRCERLEGDPPGDPCIREFRRAVAGGAIPFSVQGTENVTCLDGGRTIGWEIGSQARHLGIGIDRMFVQVGGGALASCLGASAPVDKFHMVQTEGCAPLSRAWALAMVADADVHAAAWHWAELMWPWGTEPKSVADGILDDETYDWLGVFEAMVRSNGWPITATEAEIVAAYGLGRSKSGIDVSATGTAGLAGLLAIIEQIGPDERVAVVFSGVERPGTS